MDFTELYECKKELAKASEELVENVFLEELRKAKNRNLTVRELRNEIKSVEKSYDSATYNEVRRKFNKYLEEQTLFENKTKEYIVPTATDEEIKITVDQYGLASSTVQKKKHDDAFGTISWIHGVKLDQNINKAKLVFSSGNLSADETLDMFEDTFESFINGFIQTLKGDTYQEKLQVITDLRWSRSRDSRLLLSKSEERLKEAALNQKINSK